MSLIRNPIELILDLPVFLRKIIIISIDIICIYFSAIISLYLLSAPIGLNFILNYYLFFVITPILAPFIYLFTGQYKGIIRYDESVNNFQVFFRNFFLSLLLCFLVLTLNIENISINLLLVFSIILTFLISSIRTLLREVILISQRYSNKRRKLNIVIYSSIDQESQSLHYFKFDPQYNILAFLDTSFKCIGRSLYGIPVKEPNHLNLISNKVDKVLIDIHTVPKSIRNNILSSVNRLKLKLYTIPSMDDLMNNQYSLEKLKPFSLQDLLRRDEVTPMYSLIGPNISQKNILITGGGGSIGKELALQILNLHASKIIILELCEFNLYEVNQDLRKLIDSENLNCEIISVLGSTCDSVLLNHIFSKYEINTVFHAAAYKHVTLVEENPLQGLKNNIKSTSLLCKFAYEFNIDSIILISSDKAVRPTNIMGISKRISELIIQAYNSYSEAKIKTVFSLVRFGNVIGSSGSVIPLFLKQIKEGGPVSVTHKDVIRYFMTIPEAVNLILQASLIAEGGDIFLLDMGEPIKIYELAKQMIKLSGFTIKDKNNLDGDIALEIVGLKKGEKLFEELLIDGKSSSTKHPRIFRGHEKFIPFEELIIYLEKLDTYIEENDLESCLTLINQIVPEWDRDYVYRS